MRGEYRSSHGGEHQTSDKERDGRSSAVFRRTWRGSAHTLVRCRYGLEEVLGHSSVITLRQAVS